MFQHLQVQPPDALLALIKQFHDDPRETKLDLGVGVYRDTDGRTPVFRAVKEAERVLLSTQESKSYLGPEGDLRFVELLQPIVFGAGPYDRIAGIQTPGGTGALRLAAELAAVGGARRVWVGQPTWPNHAPILKAAGLEVKPYDYADLTDQSLLFEAMLAALRGAEAGDVVLLHGCCHNPTGIDLDLAQWDAVADVIAARGLFPLVDFAYQGLGRGLEEDAAGLRRLLAKVEQALVAYSCDKNFGLYRERTGAVYAVGRRRDEAELARGNLANLARVNWSMPPDHGAAAVRIVLDTPDLAQDWRRELTGMCERVNAVREALAAAEPQLAFLTRQRGLFSNLPVSKDVVARLRADHAIYMAGSGRVNLAGLQVRDAEAFVRGLRAAGGLGSASKAA
ncbi:MAG TPA: amino acid aminotransferase [Microvirga sp.]|jgi:aromatic-amino-acid transaminase|nr:amino acid aminotransferase [Microvirga sp.]